RGRRMGRRRGSQTPSQLASSLAPVPTGRPAVPPTLVAGDLLAFRSLSPPPLLSRPAPLLGVACLVPGMRCSEGEHGRCILFGGHPFRGATNEHRAGDQPDRADPGAIRSMSDW